MNIRINRTGHELEIQELTGRALLAGLPDIFSEVKAAPVARVPNTTWGLQQNLNSGELGIWARCSSYNQKFVFLGPNSIKKATFFHCGVTESTPEEIAVEFRRAVGQPKPARVEPKMPAFI